MGSGNGTSGEMDVKAASMIAYACIHCLGERSIDTMLFFTRSAMQVTKRLDRLIARIREMQAPYMGGEKPVDVVLVRPIATLP